MKIQSTQHNTSFNARYRVLANQEEFNHFEENILPKLDEMHDGNVDYLYAKSPSEFAFSQALEDYAIANSANIEWAAENVNRAGIPMSKSDTSILWITTGEKDSKLFSKFDRKCERLFRLRTELEGFKLIGCDDSSEIFTLKAIDKALRRESRDFFKFITKHPFKRVKNVEDILNEEQQNLNIVL